MVEPVKLNQNATEPTGGMICQLLVAVQKCYKTFDVAKKASCLPVTYLNNTHRNQME